MTSSMDEQSTASDVSRDSPIVIQTVGFPTPGSTPPTPVSGSLTPNSFGGSGRMQESLRPNFINSPGYAVSQTSFSYNVVHQANAFCSNPQQSPTTSSSGTGPSAPHSIGFENNAASSWDQHPPFNAAVNAGLSHRDKLNQPATSGLGHLNAFVPSTGITKTSAMAQSSSSALSTQAPVAAGHSVSGTSKITADATHPANTVAISAAKTSTSSTFPGSSPVASENIALQGSLALPPYSPLSSNISGRPLPIEYPPVLRAMPSTASTVPQNIQMQSYSPQLRPPYSSLPTMVSQPPALWTHPPQMGGFQHPPFLSYPGVLPGAHPTAIRGMPVTSVPLPESQPPGVSPAGSTTFAVPTMPMQGEKDSGVNLPLIGGDQNKQFRVPDNKDISKKEGMDFWTAHKTETGVVYYFNSLTGESTYQKPEGFEGEPEKVNTQPTPVSWEKLAGTEWALVTTKDGKNYYYNTKTKVSSWQVPSEAVELRKKQDNETIKVDASLDEPALLDNNKASATVNMSAPAVVTGGRDAISLRSVGGAISSSALDLVKRKLQDAGTATVSSPLPSPSALIPSDLNGTKSGEAAEKGQYSENSKEKQKDDNLSDSSSDSDDVNSGPTMEECIIQFKEMLKERGVAPFSKWDKELPKIVFDPRFKAVSNHSTRRAIFERYVRTRAEEERKEKRAAQKAAVDGFKQLLDEASEDLDQRTDYVTFKRNWGSDPRFQALDHKEREQLLNERVFLLKKAAEKNIQAIRAAAAFGFKSMLREKGDVTTNSRWSRIKDSLRDDPRYKAVRHEDRENVFNEYIAELKAAAEEAARAAKDKKDEHEKLKEREREMRKRKEREEQELERVRLKVRRKEAVSSYQALLVEKIKDPQASWTDSKPKLEKDPQGRATNPDLDKADTEKLFREHVNGLIERFAREYRSLLSEVLTAEAPSQVIEDGKTVLTSWSVAKEHLKSDPRYSKMPRKERESLWRRYADEVLIKLKSNDANEEMNADSQNRSTSDPSWKSTAARDKFYGRR